VKLHAHGIEVTLPAGWSGRIFQRSGGNATLHAGDFRLALGDGEFGDRSTGRMPEGSAFIALVEYIPGDGLKPGHGLYAQDGIRLPLDPTDFSPRRLAHIRPGQVGAQQFFTAAGRPLCLYVVLAGAVAHRRRQLRTLGAVLASVGIVPPGAITSRPV
jgi:hypothetical protein